MTTAPHEWDDTHGHIQRNNVLGIAWKNVFHENGKIDKIIFVDESSKENFITFIRQQLKAYQYGEYSRLTMEMKLGCRPHALDHFLEAAGLRLMWMPVLLPADDKRIPALLKFAINHGEVYLTKEAVEEIQMELRGGNF